MNLVINIWTFLYLIIGIAIISVGIYVYFTHYYYTNNKTLKDHSDHEEEEETTKNFISTGTPEECLNQKPELHKKGFFSKLFEGKENEPKVVSHKKQKSSSQSSSSPSSSFLQKTASNIKNNPWINNILNYAGVKDYFGIDDQIVEEILTFGGVGEEDENVNFNHIDSETEEGWAKRRRKTMKKKASTVHYIGAECAFAGEDVDVYENTNHVLNQHLPTSSSTEPTNNNTFKFFAGNKNDFKKIGLNAFKDIIRDYGGNTLKIKENATITSHEFKVDLYYEEGIHKIAIDFKPIHYSIYPNSIHKTKSEFEKFVQDEDLKKLIAFEEERIYLIFVPYTVDQCVFSEEDSSKWYHDSKSLSESERHQKIGKDLYRKLVEYYETLTSGYYFM